tara:strand:+ start:488 stop:976 length:489 start_codon:yes stop_codon:yes gene_type:complete
MSLKDRGLTEDILSKLIIEYDESAQSSILGTVSLSKRRLLVIQSKIWNSKPYFDFRVWGKNEDGFFQPTPKGFMIPLSYQESGKEETFPFGDFVNVFQGILAFPDEKEASALGDESANLTTTMLQGIVDRGARLTKPQVDKTNKRVINSFVYNPLDTEFVSP